MPSSRTGWAEVWFNGKSLGLFTIVEQVDQDFIERNFQFTKGDKYKPEPPAGTLAWRGSDITNYPNLNPELRDDSTQEAFIHLVDVINNQPITNAYQVLDLRGFFIYLAGNVALRNSDAFSEMGHNYILYENAPGRFTFIPWDMGFCTSGPDFATPDLFPGPTSGWPGGKVLLTPSLLLHPPYRQTYLNILKQFLHGPASRVRLQERIDLAERVLTNRLKGHFDLTPYLDYADALLVKSETNVPVSRMPHAVINEVLSSNTGSSADEHGDYDDWVELYNADESTLDLSGAYLSDDPANFRKWRFPTNSVIKGKSFILVWADGQPSQGPWHANFKIDASGEQLVLTDKDENGNATLDTLAVPALPRNISFGRLENSRIVSCLLPTPLAANRIWDQDNDGLPTSWELEHGLSINEPDSDLDPDQDGLSNLEEFFLGTDPRNPNSPPRLEVLQPDTPSTGFHWKNLDTRTRYWIEWSTNLIRWEVYSLSGNDSTFIPPQTPARAFFRLRAVD